MSARVPKYNGPYGDKFDKAYALIDKVIAKYKSTLSDGFQVTDLVAWYPLASEAYDLANELFPDGAKREEVIEVAKYIYCAVDPNWPWIPETLENKLEQWTILDLAIPLAIGAAWDAVHNYKAKKKG